MSLSWHRAIVGGTLLALCGCNALLGLDPLSYHGAGDGGPGGIKAGAGGTGGSGGGVTDGGGSNADAGASATLSEACVHFAEATCELATRCNLESITHSYGTVLSECIDAYSHSIQCDKADRIYGLPGSNILPSSFDSCASALSTASCATGNPFAWTLPMGNLANNQPCASPYQCSSGYCKDVSSSACGTCAPTAPKVYGQIGDACGWVTSTKYVYCPDANATCKNGICTATVSLGESCSDTVVCASPVSLSDPQLLCENGVCVGYGTEGMPCFAPNPTPFCRNGFYCKASTNTCSANRHVKVGQSCLPLADEVVDCPDGWCPCPDASNPNPVCQANPHEGEPCVSSKCGPPASGSGCAPGLTCGTGSICQWFSLWIVPPTGCSGS